MTRELRNLTMESASRLRQLIESRQTPPAIFGAKCDRCSLQELCLPRLGRRGSARQGFDALLDEIVSPTPSDG
jgi:CRISPR-associated exonuclease Cas4